MRNPFDGKRPSLVGAVIAVILTASIAVVQAPAQVIVTSPVPRDSAGLELSAARVHVFVDPDFSRATRVDYSFRISRRRGAREREFTYHLGGPHLDLVDSLGLEVRWDGSPLPTRRTTVRDTLLAGDYRSGSETWIWSARFEDSQPHELTVGLGFMTERLDCAAIDGRFEADLAGLLLWPTTLATLPCTVTFSPQLGRECIEVVDYWDSLTVTYDRSAVSTPLRMAPRALGLDVDWNQANGGAPVLTERHVSPPGESTYEHRYFDWGGTCEIDDEEEAFLGDAQPGGTDTLSLEGGRFVQRLRAAAASVVSELDALADSLQSRARPSSGNKNAIGTARAAETRLNPIARSNLEYCRALVTALDSRRRPSEMAAGIEAARKAAGR